MKLSTIVFSIIAVAFPMSIVFGCVGAGQPQSASPANDASSLCDSQCRDSSTSDCCKSCCNGKYVWTPEKCVCQAEKAPENAVEEPK